MQPIKILFYVDSPAMLSHCVTAAELVRKHLGADIIMMMVDAEKYLDGSLKNYRVYDYGSLYNLRGGFLSIWPPVEERQRSRTLWQHLRRMVKGRSTVEATERIGRQSKIVQFASLPFAFVVLATFHVSKLVRRNLRFVRTRLWHAGEVQLRRASVDLSKSLRDFGTSVLNSEYVRKLRVTVRNSRAAAYEALRNLTNALRRTRSAQLLQHLLRLLWNAKGVDRFLKAIEPDLIILPEDNVETLSTIFVAKGRLQNIPTIVIPFTIPNPLEPARYYFDNPLYQARGLFAQRLINHYPKWRLQHEGRDLFRQPAIKALCQEMLGLSSPAPWILNRGSAAAIALDSDVQRDLYLTLGFPPDQLKIIGDMNGEMFHRVLVDKTRSAAELCTRFGFEPGRPLILCGFPPDQYHGTDTRRFEFPDYKTLIEAWMESFNMIGKHANVLIRPHPRIPVDYLSGFDSENIRITQRPTAELIPLCDLYVASISATIRWAVACGVPVINYDTFRYRYSDYSSALGVIDVEDLAKFRSLLMQFVGDASFAADLRERQRSVMKRWGKLDNKAAERLSTLVIDAIAEAGRLRTKQIGRNNGF
jgi:hypothetical protein